MQSSRAAARSQFLQHIFPNGVPRLWCPPLTHYDANGAIDAARTEAHWRHISRYVGGVLIPGSTGDGWELSKLERKQLLRMGIELAGQLELQILIGTLHPDANETLALIQEDSAWLRSEFGPGDVNCVLRKARVCAFTVCAPRGQDLTQSEIGRALNSVLELALPTAIYQLPQVTQNEISPELAANLAQRYENFIFFKDTSGSDKVALSGKTLDGVFTARGAEGDYAKWLKINGGVYEGLLLASANCFARELWAMIADISAGQLEAARQVSDRLTVAVGEIMKLASGLPDGNPFANANKAIDQFQAYGPTAASVAPPRLHAGSCLPVSLLHSTEAILRREGLMPVKGYLE